MARVLRPTRCLRLVTRAWRGIVTELPAAGQRGCASGSRMPERKYSKRRNTDCTASSIAGSAGSSKIAS